MKIDEAETLALSLMGKHGLIPRWRFKFDNAVRRFGLCSGRTSTISLSRKLTELNDREQVTDTILHEIAHAIVGVSHGHNANWKRKCVEIGCRPIRCYSSETVNRPTPKFVYECSHSECDVTIERQRAMSWRWCCSSCVKEGRGYNKFVIKR